MAINNENERRAGPYLGDGVQTSFPFTFKVFGVDQVKVITSADGLTESVVSPSEYSVTLEANQGASEGGTINLHSPLPNGYFLTILSNVPYTQPLNLTSRGGFYPDVINSGFDRCVILAQQLREQLNRTLIVPATSSQTPQEVLFDVLETANTANEFAQAAKAVHEDVIKRNEEIVEIRDHVDEQAAKVDGAIEAIQEAEAQSVSEVQSVGQSVALSIAGMTASVESIAQQVRSDATASATNATVASQSATTAVQAQAEATQSAAVATQAASSAESSAKTAAYSFRYCASALANGTFSIDSVTPKTNVKVGDHVFNVSGDVFAITNVASTTFTLGGKVTSIRGAEGPQGPQGESITGPQGQRGPQGQPGPQGETGSGLEILDSFDSTSQLPATGSSGDAYFVGDDLYVWSPSANAWVNKGPIAGGGITGLMSPDPREYFLYILGEGGYEPPDEPEEDPSYSPLLDTGKLDYLVLA